MKSEILSQEQNVVVVKASFEAAEVDNAVRMAVRQLSDRVNVKGFRKGRVPRNMLELYVGKREILREAMEKLLHGALETTMDEYEFKLVTDPTLKVDPLVEGEEFLVELTFETLPEVVLADAATLTAKKPVSTVSDDEVEAVVDNILDRSSELEEITEERAAARGDVADIEFSAFRLKDDGSLEPLSKEKEKNVIELDSNHIKEGFLDEIIGRMKGEEFSFNIAATEDGDAPDMLHYDMKLLDLRKKIVPEKKDEVVAELSNGEFKTVDEMRAGMRHRLQENANARAYEVFLDNALEVFAKASEVEVPASMIERQSKELRFDNEEMLEKYLKAEGLTMEEYDKVLSWRAESAVRASLVLGSYADTYGITVTNADLNEEVFRMAQRMGMRAQDLAEKLRGNDKELNKVISRVRNRNAIQDLAGKMTVEEVVEEASPQQEEN